MSLYRIAQRPPNIFVVFLVLTPARPGPITSVWFHILTPITSLIRQHGAVFHNMLEVVVVYVMFVTQLYFLGRMDLRLSQLVPLMGPRIRYSKSSENILQSVQRQVHRCTRFCRFSHTYHLNLLEDTIIFRLKSTCSLTGGGVCLIGNS